MIRPWFSLTRRISKATTGQRAVTHWRVVDRREGPDGKTITLVEFKPETGRTHQIRIHALAGLGAALLGDPIYGTGEGAARTMLHAAALTVPREGKAPIVATAPLPEDFRVLGFAVQGFEPEAEQVAEVSPESDADSEAEPDAVSEAEQAAEPAGTEEPDACLPTS